MGAIPLLVHLHESEVTSLPAPSPYLVLAPRNGYLPLIADSIKPHFQGTLPPGSDTILFDYEGLALKWHIPTGVLFDLLCAEPERPWNLTVHFRAYPLEVWSPCEGEDSVKWNFVNALKEASYVMHGSTKSVMNLSQLEQSELWRSVVKGDLDSYDHLSSRLKPGINLNASAPWNLGRTASRRPSSADSEVEGKMTSRGDEGFRLGRLPMRFYIRSVKVSVDDLCDCSPIDSWDQLVYMTRPIDIPKNRGRSRDDTSWRCNSIPRGIISDSVLTLRDALMKVVPYLFAPLPLEANSEVANMGRSPTVIAGSYPAKISKVSNQDSESEKRGAQSGETVEGEPVHASDAQANQSLEVSAPSEEESRMEQGRSPQTSRGGMSEVLQVNSARQFQGIVRIQGIEPNLDIPLDWLARNLCGPEMFIHLCIFTWATR